MGNLTIRFLLLYTNLKFSLENKPKKTPNHFTIHLVHAFQGFTARNFVEINVIINNIIL